MSEDNISANSGAESSGLDIKRLKSGFVRRKFSFAFMLVAMLALSVLIAFLVPATYKSKSTILIEQQEIPQDLVRSTVTSYADQRIETITQRVMTSANLWKIVNKYDLYKKERKKETREYIIDQIKNEDIGRNVISADVVDPRSGRPITSTIAFQLSFTYENAKLAQKVANELTTLFLNENIKNRSEMAEQASRFLTEETDKLNETVNSLEKELAAFKEENFEALPELTDVNLRLLDRTEQSLRQNKLSISNVKERIVYLDSELAQIDPIAPIKSFNTQFVMSPKEQLKTAKQRYDFNLSKYSKEHPTVIQMKKEIDRLMEEVDDFDAPLEKIKVLESKKVELSSKYSDEHPDVLAISRRIDDLRQISVSKDPNERIDSDNPAYLQIRAQKEAAKLELASLLVQEKELKADMVRYEERLTQAPRIEQVYSKLKRDYQSAVIKYAEVKAKLQEANLGESLEIEQKGERFTLIEPPLVPEEPHSPNRVLLVILGVIASFIISIGYIVVREMLDKTIRGRQELLRAIGAPPLAVIPMITTLNEDVRAKKQRLMILCAAVIVIAIVLSSFHAFIKPLDVTWYVLMRKIGLH